MRLGLKIGLLFSCLLLLACQNREELKMPPQFTWEAFQRFWGKSATPFVTLNGARKTDDGYVIDYGHGVTLTIKAKDDIVTGAEVVFTSQANEGGQQFLRLVNQIMNVGVFRWTGEEIATMRNFFGPMDTVKKELSYKTSHFIRQREENIWSFELIFIVNSSEMWSNIPIQNTSP